MKAFLHTFNSPVSQLLMLENSHVHRSILAVFFLYGMVISPAGIFLLHISVSDD